MPEDKTQNKDVHAPYNFVPFSNVVIQRYENLDEMPDYGTIDPKLKTGEIIIGIEAETPIYVSNGKENEDFFKGADGVYQIPGSSVRGMIRENMQILGFGLIRPNEDILDYQIFFRDIASAKKSVAGKLNTYYTNVLDIDHKKINSKPVSIPRNVLAGYIYQKEGKFYIRSSRYIRVSRKNPGMHAMEKNGVIPPAMYRKVGYIEGDEIIKEIAPVEKKKPGMQEGILLSTGSPIGKKNQNQSKENHLYVFEKENKEIEGEEIKEEDILSYQEDWENRKNSLKAYYDPDFWKLPEEGESKPVFYIKYNEHVYFGMTLFPRIGYPHTISEGLPVRHKRLNNEEKDKIVLDYPYAILGFARGQEGYRSRISVGDFRLEAGKRSNHSYNLLGCEPKPSYYAGYLRDNGCYVDDDFTLRGYKRYWMREKALERKPGTNTNIEREVKPFDIGTKFKGVIRFRNLHEDELGLLLWCLQLETGCYQSLGMGAPYGLGRVKIEVQALREMDTSFMYSVNGFQSGLKKQNANINKYISKYKEFVEKRIANNTKNGKIKAINDRSEIKDFFFMCQISKLKKEEMAYMELVEYKNAMTILKKAEEIRTKQEEAQREKNILKETPVSVGGLDLSNLQGYRSRNRDSSKSKKRK